MTDFVPQVKSVKGLGMAIDVILLNGELHEGDTMVVCGMNGPIVTSIRALLTPHSGKEIRVEVRVRALRAVVCWDGTACRRGPQTDYDHWPALRGTIGVRICGQDLEKAVAGTQLLVCEKGDEIEDLKQEVMADLESIMSRLHRESRGVFVQASTLGSLEALMEYLRSCEPPVPVAGVAIGPVHRKDVIAASVMLEHKEECVAGRRAFYSCCYPPLSSARRAGTRQSSRST